MITAVRLAFTLSKVFYDGFTLDTVRLFETMIVEIHMTIINAALPSVLVFTEETRSSSIDLGPRRTSIYTLPNSDIEAHAPRKRKNLPDFKFPMTRREDDAVTVGTSNSQRVILKKEIPAEEPRFSFESSIQRATRPPTTTLIIAPIRIAFIGLSATAGWASRAYLAYLQQTSKYKVTAICNSSKESSEAAITAYELSSAKAYGSPEELAADSDAFDLAVCSVRVDRHYATIKPVVEKGKDASVEWPLGKNLNEAQELYDITQKTKAKTMVGLQARSSPMVNKVKQLIADSKIGRVLSSNVRSTAGNLGAADGEAMGRLFNDPTIGVNMMSIHFGHMIDYVLFALDQELSNLNGIVSTQRKNVKLKTADGSLIDATRGTPDEILLQGHLSGGAVLSIHQRGGSPFKGTPGLTWRIEGEKGEIEITSAGTFLQVGYGDDMHIKLHDHEKDEVTTIDWAVKDSFEGLPQASQNVARVYEAFADGNKNQYSDWKEAVARHNILEKIAESSESGRSVSL